jgi:hypothetical protein
MYSKHFICYFRAKHTTGVHNMAYDEKFNTSTEPSKEGAAKGTVKGVPTDTVPPGGVEGVLNGSSANGSSAPPAKKLKAAA